VDLRESPGKEDQDEGRLVNITQVNLNNRILERSLNDCISSGQSSLGSKKTYNYVETRLLSTNFNASKSESNHA
jgi:hypothetical protein